VRSARGLPPVSATPTRSRRTGRHASARRAPARRSRGATCQRRPDQRPAQGAPLSAARGATFQWEGCHQSAASPATLAIVVSGCSRTACRVNVRALPTKVDPLAQKWCGPRRDRVQVQRVCRAPHSATRCAGCHPHAPTSGESRSPAENTRCPDRLRPIRTRLRPGDPCRAIAGWGRSGSVTRPCAPL
jgi:hypothetical protein